MVKVGDFQIDGRWGGGGGVLVQKILNMAHFGECLPRLAPEDRLCICPLFVSISD